MNPTNTAKEFFEGCRRLEQRINGKIGEAERLRLIATRATASYSDEPRSGGNGQGPVERAALQLVELEREIAAAIDEMVEHRKKAQLVIEGLPDDRYRDVLTWRYFSMWSWEKIAEAMNCERMQVWRLHGRALLEANRQLGMAPPSRTMLTFSSVTE